VIVYCATTNPGKIREFRMEARGDLSIETLPGLQQIEPPEETGTTFEENAIIKALHYGAFTTGWLFAEDSGLEVDALSGEPGVLSARFSGRGATDESNNALLLARMGGISDRTARYACALALVQNGSLVSTFHGTVEGMILEQPRGTGGFGYDPLFFYPGFGATFAEAGAGQKQSVSHRGNALRKLIASLTRVP
jgi:XTP/dITP diphosphohydrolase